VPKQHPKASIAKAAAFMYQRLHSLAKTMIVAAASFVTDRHSAKANGFKRRRPRIKCEGAAGYYFEHGNAQHVFERN